MIEFEIKADVEPKDNYDKALKLLIETDNAIQKLTPQELSKLVQDFSKYKGMYGLYQMMQQRNRWGENMSIITSVSTCILLAIVNSVPAFLFGYSFFGVFKEFDVISSSTQISYIYTSINLQS